jgi:uncharacterized repeat protein (TIGR04138 family)
MSLTSKEFYQKIKSIVEKDKRYSINAYFFVFEALDFTLKEIGQKRHVTGLELLEGIKKYSLQLFGPLAKMVFNTWGIKKTDDFGEIVFNLVENKLMSKTEKDTKNEFKDVFDFDDVFRFDA